MVVMYKDATRYVVIIYENVNKVVKFNVCIICRCILFSRYFDDLNADDGKISSFGEGPHKCIGKTLADAVLLGFL